MNQAIFSPLLVLTLSLFITLDTGPSLQPTTLAKNLDWAWSYNINIIGTILMVLHYEIPDCMYVCVKESVFVCSSVHACVYVCMCVVLDCVCMYRIVLMFRPVFVQVYVCVFVCFSLSLSLSLPRSLSLVLSFSRTYTHTHIHKHTHTHTHIHIPGILYQAADRNRW